MHLRRGDDGDLSEHERQLLHHIPAAAPGVPLGDVARHLALPNSSASVLVKDLARRGFVRRARDPRDERRLALVLTRRGAERVAADSVLDPERLARRPGRARRRRCAARWSTPSNAWPRRARHCPHRPRAAAAARGRPRSL